MKTRSKKVDCESCDHWKTDPITICSDCDREYIMVDVRYYRALRKGEFKLPKPIKSLEQRLKGVTDESLSR